MATERSVLIKLGAKADASANRAFSRMRKGIKRLGIAAKKALNFGKIMAASVLVAGTSLALLIKKVADVGDRLDKMSKRTGLTVRFLNQLAHAAELSGTTLEVLEKGTKKLAQSASDAADGLVTYTREFKKLGVTVTDSNGDLKDTEQLFLETVTALAKLENNTLKTAIASKIFGRAGTALLPMLMEGKEGLRAMMLESERLGFVWNSKTAGIAAELNDQFARLKLIVGGAATTFAVQMMPTLIKLAERTQDWFVQNKELINQKLEVWATKLANNIVPVVEKTIEAGKAFATWIAEHPKLIKMAALLIGAQASGLTGIATALALITTNALIAGRALAGMGAAGAAGGAAGGVAKVAGLAGLGALGTAGAVIGVGAVSFIATRAIRNRLAANALRKEEEKSRELDAELKALQANQERQFKNIAAETAVAVTESMTKTLTAYNHELNRKIRRNNAANMALQLP